MTGAMPGKMRTTKRKGLPVRSGNVVATGPQRETSTKTEKVKAKSRFVLVYQGLKDPDATMVRNVVRQFAPATVKEVLPGTLSVEGDGADIKRRADQLELWQLAQEGRMSNTSPTETQFEYLRT